jgi:hypothetical protein
MACKSMSALATVLGLLLVLLLPLGAHAQGCQNTVQTGCGVYTSCFAKYCPCPDGPTEYFKSYGAKYCEAFLANTKFSEQGKKWRDATLRCLQEAIVPHLDISEDPKCDCGKMRDIAYRSHTGCYTQKGASICALGPSDMGEIAKTIDVSDFISNAGRAQMREISTICASDETLDENRRQQWRNIESLLK